MKFNLNNHFLCLTTTDKRMFTMLVIDNDDPTHSDRLMKLSRYRKSDDDIKNRRIEFINGNKKVNKAIVQDFTELTDDEEIIDEEKIEFGAMTDSSIQNESKF